jgi:hypothetical protein
MIGRLGWISVVALLIAATLAIKAQETSGIPVQFAGRIASIDGTVLTVNRLRIDVSGAEVNTALLVEAPVVVRGVLLDSGVITAQTITVFVPPTPTATSIVPTPVTVPPTLDPANLSIVQPTPYSMTIVGQVEAITDGTFVIGGYSIPYDPDDPLFADLQVGDILEIQANAYDVNGTTAFDVVSVEHIEGESGSEMIEEPPPGMGMGMGEGMGD